MWVQRRPESFRDEPRWRRSRELEHKRVQESEYDTVGLVVHPPNP